MNISDGIENAEDRLATTARVHEFLVASLAELYGDSICVDQAPAPEHGMVQYGFDHGEYRCAARVEPLNDRAAVVCVTARLGRFHTGYGRALRWLACNRQNNTVGLSLGQEQFERKELWVACSRITASGDSEGVRDMVADVGGELSRLTVAFAPGFPQALGGSYLYRLEKECGQSGDEAMLMLATFPKQFMEALESDEAGARDVEPVLPVMASGWLARWTQVLRWLDRLPEAACDDEDDARIRGFLLNQKLVALGRLGRWQEVMRVTDEIEAVVADSRDALQTHRAGALCGFGRYDEALAVCPPVECDDNPRLLFWRSVAQARLGQMEAAKETYTEYEQITGPDIIGRAKLTRLLPEESS